MTVGRFCANTVNYIVSTCIYMITICCIVIFECLKVLSFLSHYVLQFSICYMSLKLVLIVLRILVVVWGLDEPLHWEALHWEVSHVNKGLMHFEHYNTVFHSTITCYFLSFYCYLDRPVNWCLLRMWYSRDCWVYVQQARSHVNSCRCYQFCWHFLGMNVVVIINHENDEAVELKIIQNG